MPTVAAKAPPSGAAESLAESLARWAVSLDPSEDDLALARRSLLDTVGVMWAARRHPLCRVLGRLTETGRLAALAHVLDYDDLHLPSTTHVSAVCVPVALTCGRDDETAARAYLAGAGAMARLGVALGWRHYAAGWHATCTAGAFGAAVTARRSQSNRMSEPARYTRCCSRRQSCRRA